MGPEMMHSVGMAWGWIFPTLVVLAGGAGRIERSGSPGNLHAGLYSLAKKYHGRLTVSTVVVETGLSPAEAERVLESMTDNVRVRMEVTE